MPNIWSLFSRRPASVRRAPKRLSPRLFLEQLEARVVLDAHIGNVTYTTIQAAVNAAQTGDTITVDPGTYAEKVTVNKSVIIDGAQAGVAGQSPNRSGNPSTESVVTGSNGSTSFNIMASDVTIDGFTVEGANHTDSNNFGYGISIVGGVSGTHIQNNIIQDNVIGLGLANGSGNQAVIQDNLIRNNNQVGSGEGTGIASDKFVTGGSLQNALIQNNVISGNHYEGIGLIGDSTTPASNILISSNTLDSNGVQIALLSVASARINGNTLTNATTPVGGGIGIGLYGSVNNLNITNNLLAGGAGCGVLSGNFGNGANSNVALNNNSISGFPTGLHLENNARGPTYNGQLNATGNYWGSPTGPTSPNNPGGMGEKIDDPDNQVDFKPWLSSGSNGVSSGQAGFSGDQGSLISSNPPAPGNGGNGGNSDLLSTLRQQILHDLILAQQIQGDLTGAEQALSSFFSLASLRSGRDAAALVIDEVSLTFGGVVALKEAMLGISDPALLNRLDHLESAIDSNPLTSTPEGQQIIDLTGALVVAAIL